MLASLPDTLSTRGVLGYLPGHPDLVRVRGGHRATRALEQWLERGLHQARWEQGAAFAGSYGRLVYRFIFRADNSEQVVAGVLYASEDSHGRPFPFVAFELIPTAFWDQTLLVVLERSGAFFEDLEALVPALVPLGHLGQVHGRVLAGGTSLAAAVGRPTTDEQLACEQLRYRNFLDETTLGDLVVEKTRDPVATFLDLMGLLRGAGRDPRALRVGLQLALVRPPRARHLELRFYAELVLRLAGAAGAPTFSMFWRAGEGPSGTAFLCSREPSFDLFSALLRPEVTHRAAYVPGRSQPSSVGCAVQPSAAIQPSLTLAELMNCASLPLPLVPGLDAIGDLR